MFIVWGIFFLSTLFLLLVRTIWYFLHVIRLVQLKWLRQCHVHKSHTMHHILYKIWYFSLSTCVYELFLIVKIIFGKVQRSNPVKKCYVTPTCRVLLSLDAFFLLFLCAFLALIRAHKTINVSGGCQRRSWTCGGFINNDRVCVCVWECVLCIRAISHDSLRVCVCVSTMRSRPRVLTVLFCKTCYCCWFKHVRANCQNFRNNA